MELLLNKSERIANSIERKICDGAYTDKLPSEQTIAEEYAAARMTAARALNLLVERGLAVRIPFKGTYVKKAAQRKIRVMGNDYFFRCLADYVPRRFPGLSVVQVKSIHEAELMILTTFTPFEYESRLLPLPRPMVERIEKAGRHYPLASRLHSSGKNCYGIPALFSPFLLAYDREPMRELEPGFEPYSLTLEQLPALKKKAEALNIALIDPSQNPESLFYSLLDNLSEIPPKKKDFQKVFELFDRLTESGDRQRFLFRMITRHGASSLQKNGGDFDIAPIPLINGTRYCSLASETLFVNRDAENPDPLFEICEASVMPDFQRILTAGHYAIPIHRDCALDSIGCPKYRDDFFFAEIGNLFFGRYNLPFPLKREIRFAFDDGKLTDRDKETILQTLGYIENESRRNRFLLEKMHYYTGSTIA
ncbi:MAG: DNA-binding transcriptional regulator FrlR [Lentisphaerae bacterium ADurb.Bin242]|nr:MAG: DNA-binding transcriptional regulator FrlR [Lentisphaerae bacterium ADurb.Bin242]